MVAPPFSSAGVVRAVCVRWRARWVRVGCARVGSRVMVERAARSACAARVRISRSLDVCLGCVCSVSVQAVSAARVSCAYRSCAACARCPHAPSSRTGSLVRAVRSLCAPQSGLECGLTPQSGFEARALAAKRSRRSGQCRKATTKICRVPQSGDEAPSFAAKLCPTSDNRFIRLSFAAALAGGMWMAAA